MANALIVSQSFDGHRQMYVFVVAHILRELGHKIFIASNLSKHSDNISYIDKVTSEFDGVLINTCEYSREELYISKNEMLTIKQKFNIDILLFAEADNHLNIFIDNALSFRNKLSCKIIGIFLRPYHIYSKMTFIEKLKYVKHLPKYWKSDKMVFFNIIQKYFRPIDVLLSIDENFVSRYPHSQWLPDVFQSYTEQLLGVNTTSANNWIEKLTAFKNQNPGKFIFLYFGTAQYRRGYDTLIKLAVEFNACFIHCGLRIDDPKFPNDLGDYTKMLKDEGRFFETSEYIDDPQTIEAFFRSATHIILPYRKFYGSSGVMLQALTYGIPVLVPNNGIMGIRVNKYNLGMIYDECDAHSFKYQLSNFINTNPGSFKSGILRFLQLQDYKILKQNLIDAISGTNKLARAK